MSRRRPADECVRADALRGSKVRLREAMESDRRNVYEWLAHSDVTPSMMGPPQFPEHAVPTWDEFCRDYGAHYFDGSKPDQGRCFIIVAGQVDVGVVCYNTVCEGDSTSMDIWLRSEADCGKGLGSDALRTLADYLDGGLGITPIAISPSARNRRAIAAYERAGFGAVPADTYHDYVKPEDMEYEDNVVLVKDSRPSRFSAHSYRLLKALSVCKVKIRSVRRLVG